MPIFDQGYQHWNGKLSSQLWRWLAITRHGIQMQLRSKLTRYVTIACFGPALALAAFMILWSLFEQGNEYIKPLIAIVLPKELLDVPHEYRLAVWTLAFHFFFYLNSFLLMLLVLLVGPNLISRDIRFNALPLYLSRPLSRWEYFLGKLGVIAAFVLAVTAIPACFAWLLGVLFSLKLTIVLEVLPLLGGSLLVSLMMAVVYGLWMLALSSLSRNSRYVSMMWFAWWLLTSSLALMLFFASGFEDWSNLAGFTKNIQRVEEAMLNTEPAWQKIDQAVKIAREALVAKGGNRVPVPRVLDRRVGLVTINTSKGQVVRSGLFRSIYPWYWSAGALLFLGVLSLCILTFRVKSLDRLR